MKALTLKHPWPWAIVCLGKRVENRRWTPARSQLREGDWFAIHGGKIPEGRAVDEFLEDVDWILARFDIPLPSARWKFRPGITALARYGGFVTASDDPWFCGPYGWLLSDVLILPSAFQCRGAQGLWDVPGDVARTIEAEAQRQRRASWPNR